MYVAMPKPGRANIRIEDDLKAEANILAEMHRWDLSTLIRTLLNEAIEAARKNTPAAFVDAAKRLEAVQKAKTGRVARVAVAPPSNINERTHAKAKRISAGSRARAAGGGRKR